MDELSVTFSALSLYGPSFFRILDLPLVSSALGRMVRWSYANGILNHQELFSSVCDHMDDDSLRKTRLVCRTLSHRSAFTFGSRFFSHLVAMPHMESLTVLLRYAYHQKFSRFVNTLSISGETGPPSTTYAGIPASTVEDMLTEALRSFENLETIRIDTCSYLRLEHLSSEAIGLRCGPERLRMEQL